MRGFRESAKLKDKVREILVAKRMENPQEDLRRAQNYLLMDCFYRGYQQIGQWGTFDGVTGWPAYDDAPVEYQENRFRRNVLINAGALIKMEPSPVIRPASGNIDDLESAQTGQDAWEKAKDEICYDRLLADKSLFKPLFGNAFIYSGYQTSRRFGTILIPKFRYEDAEIPGGAVCSQCSMIAELGTEACPQCQGPMEQQPAIPIQNPVLDKMVEKDRGSLFSTCFSPLEIKVRSKVKGGLVNAPYLLRVWREDVEKLEYAYKKEFRAGSDYYDAGNSNDGGSSDILLRYQGWLASLQGNPNGANAPYAAMQQEYAQSDVIMGWLTPETYRGDKELLKEFPDGLTATLVGMELAEDPTPERLTDRWAHEVYYPNAHSFYGDGMYDDIPIQRSINKIGMLTERHLEYDTIPLRLFDASLIQKNDLTNDPALKWIAVQTTMDKGLDKAVRDLNAQNLSWDVIALYQARLSSSQDISGATDPLGGKIAGANTPYSAQLLAVEQGQTRFLPSARYNKDAIKEHVRQTLMLAQKNWTDPRTLTEIDQNTGRATWKQFQGTDLSKGNWNVYVGDSDFKPRTRGEQMQALDMARQYGIDVLSNPRQRLQFYEKVGLDPSGDMLSTQARRAGRIIEWYRQGTLYTPRPFIDDGMIQAPVMFEFLASPQGDDLLETQPEAFEGLLQYVQAVVQMAAMQAAAMGGMGLPMIGGGMPQPQGGPQGQQGQKQEHAQSNVPDESKMPMPQSPARQQQAAGALPA